MIKTLIELGVKEVDPPPAGLGNDKRAISGA